MELNKIYNGDFLNLIKEIPDKSIDLILTDPPYGITANKWDTKIPLGDMFTEFNRAIKDNGCMAIFAQQPFLTDLINANRKYFRYEWIWNKHSKTGFLNANKMPLKIHENIAIFYKHLPTYNPQFEKGKPYIRKALVRNSTNYKCTFLETNSNYDGKRYPFDIVDVPQVKKLSANNQDIFHPTQKPVELFEYLIKTYTNEGDVVFDPFMGSGTTAVACIETGRNYIGYELDKEYFFKANKRIQRVQQGGRVERTHSKDEC